MALIVASREKTLFRVGEIGGQGGPQKRVSIRCNRIVATLEPVSGDASGAPTGSPASANDQVVVRSRTLWAGLRTLHSLMLVRATHPDIWAQAEGVDRWVSDWLDKASFAARDAGQKRRDWVSVYRNGLPLFSTKTDEAADRIERLVRAKPISKDHMSMFAQSYFQSSERRDIDVSHDAESATVIDSSSGQIKVAIHHRQLDHSGQLMLTVPRQASRGGVLMVLELVADIMELNDRLEELKVIRRRYLEGGDTSYAEQRAVDIVPHRHLLRLKEAVASSIVTLGIECYPSLPVFELPIQQG